MKHLVKLGLATAMILVATCGVAGTASATTIEPANTPFIMSSTSTTASTSATLVVDPEQFAFGCSSTITGTTGVVSHGTWASAPADTLGFTLCTTFGGSVPSPILTNEACHTPLGRITLHLMSTGSSTAIGTLTLPHPCTITISIPLTGCTMTITGTQNIGNGTAGAGGIDWTNRSPKSRADFNGAIIERIGSNGVGAGCPTAGNHTGTLFGNYDIISPTNVITTG
jgi:hypothetical protein